VKVSVLNLSAQIAAMFVVFALLLFLPAGTVHWAAGWIFLALFFAGTIAISVWLFEVNPALLNERLTGMGKADQKAWDKALMLLISLVFLAWLIVMPLDAVRFQWSHVPVWVQAVGGVLFVIGWYVIFLAYRENTYLSPAVRIQLDREQTVISTGPYRFVRHPMYAGVIPFIFGTSLLLGSWYGVLGGFILILLIARRAVLEERTLREELPGYAAYMAQVKYRMIPHLW